MVDVADRYDRNILLFGAEGQKKLLNAKVTVIGIGGVGSALVQHLALLGVGNITLVDNEELDETNRNRFVGARYDDPIPGSAKVSLAARYIKEVNPDIITMPIRRRLETPEAFDAIRDSDWIFGCLDSDGPRSILNEVCAVFQKPYIDLAADVPETGVYGGRVCVMQNGEGCLHCLGLLDGTDVRRYFLSNEEKAKEAVIYGIPVSALGDVGPAVSPVNGVIAALAATEFMVAVTGLRSPTRYVEFWGHRSKVLVKTDSPTSSCPYCEGIRGKSDEANVERFWSRKPEI